MKPTYGLYSIQYIDPTRSGGVWILRVNEDLLTRKKLNTSRGLFFGL